MRESPPVPPLQLFVSGPPGQEDDATIGEVAPGLERAEEEAQQPVLTPEVEGGQETEGRHDEEEDGGEEGTPPSPHTLCLVLIKDRM